MVKNKNISHLSATSSALHMLMVNTDNRSGKLRPYKNMFYIKNKIYLDNINILRHQYLKSTPIIYY